MHLERLDDRIMLTAGTGAVDFRFDSELFGPAEVAAFNSGDLRISATNEWYKPVAYNDAEFSSDGHLVAARTSQDADLHTMLVARVRDSECFGVEGLYTLPNNHYKYSFDVRFPQTEEGWLRDHTWSVVSQLWGPREDQEVALNPAFSIYTSSIDGEPHWTVAIRGDSRRFSTTRDYDHSELFRIPFTGRIGDWHTWDVELVIDPFGGGLMRTWLDGELVAEQVDVSMGYHAFLGGERSGPLNPAFGLYAPLAGDKMEAHFDNIQVSCSSNFDRSIAGRIDSLEREATVVAVNRGTGQRFETQASLSGVFALNVPAGSYDVSALDSGTGNRQSARIDVRSTSVIANIDLLGGSCREADGTRRFGGNCESDTTQNEQPDAEPQSPTTETPIQPNDVPTECYEADGTRFFDSACVADSIGEIEEEQQPMLPIRLDAPAISCVRESGSRTLRGGCTETPDVSVDDAPSSEPANTILGDCFESDGTRFFGQGCGDNSGTHGESESPELIDPRENLSGRVSRQPLAVLAVSAAFQEFDERWLTGTD